MPNVFAIINQTEHMRARVHKLIGHRFHRNLYSNPFHSRVHIYPYCANTIQHFPNPNTIEVETVHRRSCTKTIWNKWFWECLLNINHLHLPQISSSTVNCSCCSIKSVYNVLFFYIMYQHRNSKYLLFLFVWLHSLNFSPLLHFTTCLYLEISNS